MIERKIINDELILHKVNKEIRRLLDDVQIHKVELNKNQMGHSIMITTPTPGFVIGREGKKITELTKSLSKTFKFKNLKINVNEFPNQNLSSACVAKNICNELKRFGSQKFKLSAYRSIKNSMGAGAMGIEIRISGKIPSSRSKSWRFAQGYMKKTGYVSDFLIDKYTDCVTLKTGVVGVKVMIMLPNTPLPDKIIYLDEKVEIEEEKEEEKVEEKKPQYRQRPTNQPKEEEIKSDEKIVEKV